MRKFVIEVKMAEGPYYGVYVTLLENLKDPEVSHLRLDPVHTWRVWYHDRLVASRDVKPAVKNHIDLVRSFDDKVQIDIRDLRNVQTETPVRIISLGGSSSGV